MCDTFLSCSPMQINMLLRGACCGWVPPSAGPGQCPEFWLASHRSDLSPSSHVSSGHFCSSEVKVSVSLILDLHLPGEAIILIKGCKRKTWLAHKCIIGAPVTYSISLRYQQDVFQTFPPGVHHRTIYNPLTQHPPPPAPPPKVLPLKEQIPGL